MSYLAARSSKKVRFAAARSVDEVVMVRVRMNGGSFYSELGLLYILVLPAV